MTAFSPEVVALVLALGLVFSLGCYLVTNLSPGGMITPGWIAFALLESPRLALLLGAVVVATYVTARGVGRVVILYGKRLFASVLVLGVFFSTTAFLALSDQMPALTETGTLGFITPGLVAYQLIRQPLAPTLVAISAVTSLVYSVVLVGVAGGVVPRRGATDIGLVHAPALDPAQVRLAILALGAVVALVLLAHWIRRGGARGVVPVLRGTRDYDAAADLARRAAELPSEHWRGFLLELRDHAHRSGLPSDEWLEGYVEASTPEKRLAYEHA